MLRARPKLWRLVLGFFLAPLAAVIFAGATSQAVQNISRGMLPSMGIMLLDIPSHAIVGGYPIGLGIGIPVYLVLRGRLLPSLRNVVLAGALVGATPVLFMILTYARSAAFESVRSAIEAMMYVALIGVSGAAGGAVFWLCTVWRDPVFHNEVTQASSS